MRLFLALSLGIVYAMFGALKFFPGYSPAEGLATMTIDRLIMGIIPASITIKLLALWEVSVGILFLTGRYMKVAVILGLLHMILTFTPIFLFPDLCFKGMFQPELLTQYILKNLVFIVAMMGIYPSK